MYITGREYKPDLTDDLKMYYPFDILKSAAGVSSNKTEDKTERKNVPDVSIEFKKQTRDSF